MTHVTIPERRVPVGCEADVVVAGAGSAGLIAAVAAARAGARVVLVDRMAAPGGNMGPGMICGATFGIDDDDVVLASLKGVAGEFYRRLRAAMGDMPAVYATASHAASYVGVEMCREAGVRLVLSAYAGDPIMRGTTVAGLLVETKSGTIAFPARVVIDATGDADIARRAGAPMRLGCSAEEIATSAPGEQVHESDGPHSPEYPSWNDGQLYFYLGEAEIAKYVAFGRSAGVQLTAGDRAWAQRHLRIPWKPWPDAMIPILRSGWESGEFRVERDVRPNVIVALNNWFSAGASRPNIMGGRAGVFGDYDSGSWEDVSMMEAEVRSIVHAGVRFFRDKRVPGFENAFLLCMSPFLGARGGPFIDGEYVLTPREAFDGARFPDVCMSHQYNGHRNPPGAWFEWPYRAFLPKMIDGLLVAGRGMSFLRRGHDSCLRARLHLIPLGEVAGLAAAISVRTALAPRQIPVLELQRAVVDAGYFLGDAARLRDLGIASPG